MRNATITVFVFSAARRPEVPDFRWSHNDFMRLDMPPPRR